MNFAGLFFDYAVGSSYDIILSTRRPWRHFRYKSAATWWVNTKRLSGAYSAAFHQLVIY